MAINSTYYLDAANLTLATAVYLDLSLTLLAPDGFYSDGTISREQSLGILLSEEICDCEGDLDLAIRSDGTSTLIDICNLEILDPSFYILGNVACVIEDGNIACNTNNALDTFDGGDLYYLVSVSICPTEIYTYIAQINSVGYITVIDVCPPPP